METPNNQKVSVSRSGRIRKKSSKLMDFQSPDDLETKQKKKEAKQKYNSAGTQQQQQQNGNNDINNSNKNNQGLSNDESNLLSPTTNDLKTDDEQLSSFEDFLPGSGDGVNEESFDSDDNDVGDIDLDNDPMDEEAINGDDTVDNEDGLDPTVRKSIYMTEKINKKKVLKDGKIVFGKTQRKDKGKTRFTAYMLWAKDARKQMILKTPDIDFSTTSRRLSEMWANVPNNEKQIWKRRAKKFASRIPKKQGKTNQENSPNTKISTKFLNKNNVSGKGKKTSQTENQPKQQQQQQQEQQSTYILDIITPQIHNNKTSPVISPGIYKVTGIEALDVAAHLKLLGDSLTIIGERLKEHEGQITVSGSLSVLLDSLLCSLGPLMCLTSQISGLTKNDSNLKESLRNTLDNIAYVMPGL